MLRSGTWRGSILLQAILNTSHHLLNVLLQTANKLGLLKKNLGTAFLGNVGPSASDNPMGFHILLQEYLYITLQFGGIYGAK
jgi:hypothetical protein